MYPKVNPDIKLILYYDLHLKIILYRVGQLLFFSSPLLCDIMFVLLIHFRLHA